MPIIALVLQVYTKIVFINLVVMLIFSLIVCVLATIHGNFLYLTFKGFPHFEKCFVSFRPKCPPQNPLLPISHFIISCLLFPMYWYLVWIISLILMKGKPHPLGWLPIVCGHENITQREDKEANDVCAIIQFYFHNNR